MPHELIIGLSGWLRVGWTLSKLPLWQGGREGWRLTLNSLALGPLALGLEDSPPGGDGLCPLLLTPSPKVGLLIASIYSPPGHHLTWGPNKVWQRAGRGNVGNTSPIQLSPS